MFKSELSLQEKFIELKSQEIKGNEKVLSEFNARFGNVDIVQVIVDSGQLMNYEQANLLSIYRHARVIGYLHKNAVRTFEYLKKRTGYVESVLSNTLSKLIKLNIIIEESPRRYVISDEFQFPNLQFISFEAKLTNWKKAILQATLNKKFSSYSYVVLPMDVALRLQIEKINYFYNYNVGLIGVSDNNVEYIYKPRKTPVKLSINPSFISSVAKYQLETMSFSI